MVLEKTKIALCNELLLDKNKIEFGLSEEIGYFESKSDYSLIYDKQLEMAYLTPGNMSYVFQIFEVTTPQLNKLKNYFNCLNSDDSIPSSKLKNIITPFGEVTMFITTKDELKTKNIQGSLIKASVFTDAYLLMSY